MQKNNNMVKIQKLVVGSGEHDKKVVLGIAVKFADDFAFYDCAFGLFVLGPNIKVIPKYYKNSNKSCTSAVFWADWAVSKHINTLKANSPFHKLFG